MAKKRAAAGAASNASAANVGFEAKLWLTANKLRNNMDASEYKHPCKGRGYDPSCGSTRLLMQGEKLVEEHGGNKTDVSIFGQKSKPTTWRLAHMNLIIHSVEANLGPASADTSLRDAHPNLKADFVLANPPLNVPDYAGPLLRSDKRWSFGDPPVGNANYAWIRHFIHHLAYPNDRGGVVGEFRRDGAFRGQL